MNLLSSRFSVYLVTVGAAVGLGSIWRFPFLAGTGGGFAFVLAFVVVCLAIAIPLLVAELLIGRWSRRNPPQAAGTIAAMFGGSSAWNAIGWIGSIASFLIMTYYTMIAGWVLAYTWKCATGQLTGLSHEAIAAQFQDFSADSVQVSTWQLAFVVLVAWISARGVNRGIEVANRIRAPALLLLLLILVGYALATGDVERGLTFAFEPDFSRLTREVWLAAVGQAFFATGVGMAMMIAYGSYAPHGVPLLSSAVIITLSILVVSLLATLLVFPLVFRFGMDPAQGPKLVFELLPSTFAVMPGGQLFGTLFFILLAFAALTPSISGIEPIVNWLVQEHRIPRAYAATMTAAATWVVGIGSVLSFGAWSDWRPLAGIPVLGEMNFFGAIDYVSSNILLPVCALLVCAFMGWRFAALVPDEALEPMSGAAWRAVRFAVKWVCPIALLVVLITGLS